ACFVCTKCSKTLKTGYQQKAYCAKCYAELFLPKCGRCQKVITDVNCYTAMDKHWHEQCFACSKCQKPFKDGRYWVKDEKFFCQVYNH
ncbi:unnamed protein product, partial [Soboliphyme baturini]|uniref:LIM zinc-binding domain-containing protein n=1 Tax=Soboliphyme baturini TaxID=241478 RepID=A0A183J2X0_9BILA